MMDLHDFWQKLLSHFWASVHRKQAAWAPPWGDENVDSNPHTCFIRSFSSPTRYRRRMYIEKVLLFDGICCALLSQGFQILLDIQILNAVNLGFPAAIDDISTSDPTKAVFGLGTLFGLDQMSVLTFHNFFAVLDLIKFASECSGVMHGHIKLPIVNCSLKTCFWGLASFVSRSLQIKSQEGICRKTKKSEEVEKGPKRRPPPKHWPG